MPRLRSLLPFSRHDRRDRRPTKRDRKQVPGEPQEAHNHADEYLAAQEEDVVIRLHPMIGSTQIWGPFTGNRLGCCILTVFILFCVAMALFAAGVWFTNAVPLNGTPSPTTPGPTAAPTRNICTLCRPALEVQVGMCGGHF